MGTVIHTCSCGRTYDEHEWKALPLVGYSAAEDPDSILEQRNCMVCDSSRAITEPGPGFWLRMCGQRIAQAREEAQHDLPSLSRAYVERAETCLRQARELLDMLADQRAAEKQRLSAFVKDLEAAKAEAAE